MSNTTPHHSSKEIHQLIDLYESRLGKLFIEKRLSLERNTHEIAFKILGLQFDLAQTESMLQKVGSFLKFIGLYERGAQNALDYEVTRRRLKFENLPPAFNGYTIMHLTDLHLEGIRDRGDKLCDVLKKEPCDVCLLTGDYRFDIQGPFEEALKLLKNITSVIDAKDGIFGILGNHDSLLMLPGLEHLGIRMLVNESTLVNRGSQNISIVGVDDAFYFKTYDFGKAYQAIRQSSFKILMSHTPELYEEASLKGTDLYLCGHTHGGQICFPKNNPIAKNAKCPYRLASGHWTHKNMQGITSRGIGSSSIPVRFFCRPEIAIYELWQE